MRVLFLNSNYQDYLADALFHGLRTLLGSQCVDVPRIDHTYRPLSDEQRAKLRGHGFTLYGLLPEMPELAPRRRHWWTEIEKYDLVVFSHVWWQYDLLREMMRKVGGQRIAALDGLDDPQCFPFAWRLHRTPRAYFAPVTKCRYFKRELVGQGWGHGLGRLLPYAWRKNLRPPGYARPISFAIPAEKIVRVGPENKTQMFHRDMIDPEMRDFRSGSHYPFAAESEYYADLQRSQFGVTTKRGGWDCLRHYEMAANGCVLAFRDHDLKPGTCAPHGLNSGNCVIYHDRHDLQRQMADMTPPRYARLLEENYRWIGQQTTVARAGQFLEACVS